MSALELGLQLISTLAGAFFGAWSAFELERKLEARREMDRWALAGERAVFDLWRMINVLVLIQRQVIDPVRDHPARHLVMLPRMATQADEIRLDFDSLGFLLSRRRRSMLFELAVEQQRYDTALRAMKLRDEMHLREAQPKLESAGIEEGVAYPRDRIIAVLGPRLNKTLAMITDDAIGGIDGALHSLESAAVRLRGTLVDLFPGRDFFRAELDPSSVESTPR